MNSTDHNPTSLTENTSPTVMNMSISELLAGVQKLPNLKDELRKEKEEHEDLKARYKDLMHQLEEERRGHATTRHQAEGHVLKPGDAEFERIKSLGTPKTSGHWNDVLDRHKMSIRERILHVSDRMTQSNKTRMCMDIERDVRGLDPNQNWQAWTGARVTWLEREIKPHAPHLFRK